MYSPLWLPYTQMKTAPAPLEVVGALGCKLKLADGRELVDGIANWWSACHGHRHPHIMQAVEKQLAELPHVMMAGLVHPQVTRLAERLVALTPGGLNHVFFSDSGSTAVEVALKMALQYWKLKGKTTKDRFLCFSHGYHGDTLGAMGVSDPERGIHRAFRRAVIPQFVVDIPADEYGFAELESLLSGVHKDIAGMIIEPLVQGAGGMKFHSADVLAELHRMAKKHDILFIADEIATGFYRTGNAFACNEAGIAPDIMCLGKALTAGTMTMGATLATTEIFEAFYTDKHADAFMHGPTFMGNALACAAANASLDLFEKGVNVDALESLLQSELAECEGMPGVVDVRVKGAIGVVQLAPEIDVRALRPKFPELGVWLRPFEDVIYLWPPLTISAEEVKMLTRAIKAVINKRGE